MATHAGIAWLPGGYVGVDVFFVLSGYLISGLILHEVDITGSFDPWRFYARRLKRLLPALLFVLLCASSIAWLVVSPQGQMADADAGQAATLWLSNFYFSTRAINYFSSGVHSNLYLHTWSLAVEEQFYLVWPWLLLFLYGIWRWQGTPMSYRRLVNGLGLVAISSLFIAVYWAHHQLEDGFYLMPSRAWEFALGALVLLLRQACSAGRVGWLDRLRGQSMLNTGGWLSILLAAVMYGDNLHYPGLWALLPCVGTALVLLDEPGRHPHSAISRFVLRQGLPQFIGNISYSLYLWHWPVLVLGTTIFGDSLVTRISLVMLCMLLASATYFVVEMPVHRAVIRNTAKVLFLSTAGMVLGLFIMTSWRHEAENLLNGPEQSAIQAARFDFPEINSPECDTWYHSAEVTACLRGPADASHTVVMFGDSVLAQWFPAISEIFLRRRNWRLVVLTKSACPASQVSYYYNRIKANYEVCDLWRQRALEYIVQLRPDIVIMGSRDYGFSSEQWISGTRKVLEKLSPAAGSVAIISPTPDLGFDGPNCLSREFNVPLWMPHHGRCETKLKPSASPSIRETLNLAAQPYSNVGVLELSDWVCPENTCHARIPTSIVFRDNQHLTATFVQSLAPAFEHALRATGTLH